MLCLAAGAINGLAVLACQRFVTHVTGSATRLGLEVVRLNSSSDLNHDTATFDANRLLTPGGDAMPKATVPSENVGRWVDLDDFDWDQTTSDPAAGRHEFALLDMSKASYERLRFQPSRDLAARFAAPSTKPG